MLMDKLKRNDWLDMEENKLLEWLDWMYDLEIYKVQIYSRWWWRIAEVSKLVAVIPFVLEVKGQIERVKVDSKVMSRRVFKIEGV